MARLCDLVKLGEACKLKLHIEKYRWDGYYVFNSKDQALSASSAVIIGEHWQLDEPTVDSVCEERGYDMVHGDSSWCQIIKESEVSKGPWNNWIHLKHKPTTAAETNRIIDFLETLK